jgi:hypothetical protein
MYCTGNTSVCLRVVGCLEVLASGYSLVHLVAFLQFHLGTVLFRFLKESLIKPLFTEEPKPGSNH